jgi:hypothetical protein
LSQPIFISALEKPVSNYLLSKNLIQPKLTVNTPGDVYEQEADAMADKVMRMSSNENAYQPKPATGLIGKSVQHKCSKCEEEEKKNPIMRKTEASSGSIPVSSSFASSLNASKGGGAPLPQATRSFMENAFSTDFSNVKIHTDSKAAEMNKGINARAFTYGNDIYFSNGQYTSNTEEVKKLLAHELTHVVQQGSNNSQLIQLDRELDSSENTYKECMKKIEDALVELEKGVNDPQRKIPSFIKDAVEILRTKKNENKVKCYAFDGIIHGRVDFKKDEIQYDGINLEWINTTTLLHEAVHASHGKKFPNAARRYVESIGKPINPRTAEGLKLLKFKAWTEYWAYRSNLEYHNAQGKTPDEIHYRVMQIHEVRIAVNNVRNNSADKNFDPRIWKPNN